MSFIPYNQNQRQLLPTNLNDVIPEDHLVRAVNEVVEQLNIKSIEGKYRDGGREAFHPRMMLKVLFYGYANGERSSRVLEDKLKHDVFYMWLGAMQTPKFRTIAHFRQSHLTEIKEVFVQVLKICKDLDMVKVGHWAIDGTKVKANASRYKSKMKSGLEEEERELREEIEKALKEAEIRDEEEDREYGEKESGRRLPAGIRRKEERLHRIERAIERLKKSKEAKTANTTDPEAVFMKRTGGGYDVAYNAQITVDGANQIIVAPGVTEHPADNTQLVEQVDNGIKYGGEKPREVSADSGYQSGVNLRAMEERQIDAYIPQGENLEKESEESSPTSTYSADKFRYDEGKDRYVCPEGKELEYWSYHTIKGATGTYVERIYRGVGCQGCKSAQQCTKNPDKGRTIRRGEHQPLIEKMKKKLATEDGKRVYAKRKCIVEPVFGIIKHVMKFRQFLLRGLEKVRAEWTLICLAFNIRKICGARAKK